MGKKVIRLTESQLIDSIKKIVLEQKQEQLNEQEWYNWLTNPVGSAIQYGYNNPEVANTAASWITNPIGNFTNYATDRAKEYIRSTQPSSPATGDFWKNLMRERGIYPAEEETDGGGIGSIMARAMRIFSQPKPSPFSSLSYGFFEKIRRAREIANLYATVKNGVISEPTSKYNGTKWVDYLTSNKVTSQELESAKRYLQTKKEFNEKQIKRYQAIMAAYNSVNQDGIISNPKSIENGKTWYEYMQTNNVTPEEIEKAKKMVTQITQTAVPENKATSPAVQKKIQSIKQKVNAVKQGKKLVPKTTAPAAAPKDTTVTTANASYKDASLVPKGETVVSTGVNNQPVAAPAIFTAPAPAPAPAPAAAPAVAAKRPPPGNFVMQNAQSPAAAPAPPPNFLNLPR